MRIGAVLCDVVDCCINKQSQYKFKIARENIEREFPVLKADHRVDLSYLSNHDAFIQD